MPIKAGNHHWNHSMEMPFKYLLPRFYISKLLQRKCKPIVMILSIMLMMNTGHAQSFNQDAGNPNLDFSLGNFNGWSIAWGPRDNPDSIAGTQAGANSHTIVAVYGNNYDGNAGNGNLQRVPTGLEKVGRLGAPAGGGYTSPTAYSMSYPITVHAAYPILHFQIASIMDRSHSLGDNTHYRFKIMDASGNFLVAAPCGGIELFPNGPNNPNTTSIPSIGNYNLPGTGAILYQPWQSVAVNLSAFAGQTIRIQFEHFDCISGFHGSYDYLSCAMRQALDTIYYCPENDVTIKPYLPNFKSYSWNTGSSADSLVVSNPVDGSIYNCTVTSFNGCSTTFNYRLKAIQTEADFSTVIGTTCNQMNFFGSGTTNHGAIVTYEWDFGDVASGIANVSSAQNPSHVFSAAGSYMVSLKVLTSFGCERNMEKVVVVAREDAKAAMNISAPTCVADTIFITDITSNGVSRFWKLNQSPLSDTSAQISLVFNNAGMQEISLLAIGANGCPDSISEQIMIHEKPNVEIRVVPETAPITDPQFQFYGMPEYAAFYAWNFGNGMEGNEANQTIIYDNILKAYHVTLLVTDSNGCSDTTSKWVHVMPPDVMIPDAFSPNGDGINDIFKIVNITNQQLQEFSIFNRYGQRVFYTMDDEKGWDGNFNNKACDVGTYYYLIKLQPKATGSVVYKGAIVLIR